MKLFFKSILSKNIYIFFFIFIGCKENNQSIEEKVQSHKNKIYELSDSLKIIDKQIDSLIKIYSQK
tara:strand:- start:55 stop:252 length:198 start_codon:yes stop_codon:yes gene_type:complete